MAAPPGAPEDRLSEAQAREAWERFRADSWATLAEARGQRARAATLARLRPGSWAYRAVVALAGPFLALRRRLRGPVAAPSERPFPLGEPVEPALRAGPFVEVRRLGPGESLDLTEGEGWLALVDVDQVCVPGALEAMAALGEERGADLVYADGVERDRQGGRQARARCAALGWVGQLSYDGAGPVLAVRAGALARVSQRLGASRASRADLVLALLELGAPTAHLAATVSDGPTPGPEAVAAAARASARSLARVGRPGLAQPAPEVEGLVRWRAPLVGPAPRVSVIIPTRDRLDLLEACLASLEARTDYPHLEVVIVDNDSVEPATTAFLADTPHRVVAAPGPFNYARIVNLGVAASTGTYVVTLNNDTEVLEADWLTRLVELVTLPGVGIVGAHLVEPDGAAQHEGVAIAPYPQHLRRERNWLRVEPFLCATREVSAVTGACQILSRALYDELGGMDEELAVVHNDIDLCLRAQARGHRVLYGAEVRLSHAESSTRGDHTPFGDIERFLRRWGVLAGLGDPWFPERLEILGEVVRWRPEAPQTRW